MFFIEKMSPDQSHVENVFVTSTENGKVNVVVSKNGHTETHKNGDRFVVSKTAAATTASPGQPDFRIMEYERYGVKIQSQPVVNTPTPNRHVDDGPGAQSDQRQPRQNLRGAPVCR